MHTRPQPSCERWDVVQLRWISNLNRRTTPATVLSELLSFFPTASFLNDVFSSHTQNQTHVIRNITCSFTATHSLCYFMHCNCVHVHMDGNLSTCGTFTTHIKSEVHVDTTTPCLSPLCFLHLNLVLHCLLQITHINIYSELGWHRHTTVMA